MERRIKSFFEKKPYRHVVETSANGTEKCHKIRFTKRLPERASELAMEAAEALRSALDQACFATALAAKTPKHKSTYFPIADTPAQLEDVIKRRCKDLPPDIVSFLRTLNPYQGGNDLIWSLNKLANSSKHTVVLEPVAMQLGEIHIKHAVFYGGGSILSQWDNENNEITFAKTAVGSNSYYDVQLGFGVSFGEIEAVRGQPAIPLLRQMAIEVERIVVAIEAESRRLGLIS
ncbi:MAG: hypothetical protein IRZ04_14805 [Rhodospirillales bacterium]|nr:hypothetical protein [Rhodospirillales bacterium]